MLCFFCNQSSEKNMKFEIWNSAEKKAIADDMTPDWFDSGNATVATVGRMKERYVIQLLFCNTEQQQPSYQKPSLSATTTTTTTTVSSQQQLVSQQ
jgi:hypothetical protein